MLLYHGKMAEGMIFGTGVDYDLGTHKLLSEASTYVLSMQYHKK